MNGYNITHRNPLGLFRLSAVALFRSLSAVARCLQGATGSTSKGTEVDASLAEVERLDRARGSHSGGQSPAESFGPGSRVLRARPRSIGFRQWPRHCSLFQSIRATELPLICGRDLWSSRSAKDLGF